MPGQITHKQFKLQIEFTVAMEDVGERQSTEAGDASPDSLKWLQLALLGDEAALVRQMLAAGFGRLQDYADYLAGQDAVTPLAKLAADLRLEDPALSGASLNEFADATRPLRIDSFTASIDGCTIQQKVETGTEETLWQPVWSDLQAKTDLGRQLRQYGIPSAPLRYAAGTGGGHLLQVQYLSQQVDGIHMEGRCSCGAVQVGNGEDESAAFTVLWRSFQQHLQACDLPRKIQYNQEEFFLKDKP